MLNSYQLEKTHYKRLGSPRLQATGYVGRTEWKL